MALNKAAVSSQFGSHVMKQVLLRVARLRAEVRFRKMPQCFPSGTALRKIKPPQRLRHPHIHRKDFGETISEKQNAVSNFLSDARELHERRASAFRRSTPQVLEMNLAIRDGAGRGQEIRRAEAHLAGAQFSFSRTRDSFGRGKRMTRRRFP